MNHEPPPPEGTGAAPVVVHRATGTRGRRVTIRTQTAGLARSDADLIEFLRRAGLPEAWDLLDDPHWVEWQGGRPHEYGAG
ncbi:hypothetical protein [Streptomyces formicae]|uniref:Uncharacterized protein n=1 Tax=Streptomyces formicae TaxID=1616117 RepID=A0ABY3WLA6_9ACTN|nr:hypothetical protein [Streptomyces formicae]UNM11562.1 hypothetical protein J4032_08455 [Streptomyces formicae]